MPAKPLSPLGLSFEPHLFPLQSESRTTGLLGSRVVTAVKPSIVSVPLLLQNILWLPIAFRLKSQLYPLAFRVSVGVDPVGLPKPASPTPSHSSGCPILISESLRAFTHAVSPVLCCLHAPQPARASSHGPAPVPPGRGWWGLAQVQALHPHSWGARVMGLGLLK